MALITIPSPTGATFDVVIKDAAGSIVFGPSAETNAPFDPGITDPGEYTVYTTYAGNTNGWCFSIPDCECPVATTAVISQIAMGLRYAILTFDLTNGFCPFKIQVTHGTSGSSLSYPVFILSLADFDSHSGDIYTKKIFIGSADFFTWETFLQSAPTFSCIGSQTITFECTGPRRTPLSSGGVPYYFVRIHPTGNWATWYVGIYIANCGSTCNTYTVDYVQTNALISGSPDSGTFTVTADCSSYPSSTLNVFLLSPNTNFAGYTGVAGTQLPKYNFVYNDCCGSSVSGPFGSTGEI